MSSGFIKNWWGKIVWEAIYNPHSVIKIKQPGKCMSMNSHNQERFKQNLMAMLRFKTGSDLDAVLSLKEEVEFD